VEGRGCGEGWVLKGVRLTRMGSKSNYISLLARDVSTKDVRWMIRSFQGMVSEDGLGSISREGISRPERG
jgi:hypothetical protein